MFAFVSPLNLQAAISEARRTRSNRWVCSVSFPRRNLLRLLAGAAVTTLSQQNSGGFTRESLATESPPRAGSTVFSVIPTSVSTVNLLPVDIDDAVNDAVESRAIFLGEHHNSLVDHALQARIINALSRKKPVAVGLEMVQQRFQPALDSFIAGDIDELELYFRTEWDDRWVWPYELYLPVLRLCREKRIPLVALSLNSEVLAKVKSDRGIEGLSGEEIRTHIGNPLVFATISREPAFKRYISECITPSYATHFKMGLLREAINFNSFYTARVLRDEAMATRAVRAIREIPDALLVCLLGADHVKFEYGVKTRAQRQLLALEETDRQLMRAREVNGTKTMRGDALNESTSMPPAMPRMISVMLNPGPADAFDPRDKSLKLEMEVGENPVPISDYLWFSSPGEARPRRRAKSQLLPPVERLTS